MKPKVIVIVGPTASGKSDVSIGLAKKIDGEIISADSMQIYKEMNIGTAKLTEEEKEGIPHYMIDIINPDETFNVAMYQKMAVETIYKILQKGKVPIVVGGTGLYVSTLVNGIEFLEIGNDETFRNRMEEKAREQGAEVIFDELQKVDAEAAKVIDKNNIRRAIRALEIYYLTGKNKTTWDKESIKEVPFDYKMYGILWDRQILYERINQRVDNMINAGLIDEVKQLKEKYNFSQTALQGLGYKEVISYLDGNVTKDEMIEKLKMETRRYAKRQITWFKRDARIQWFPINEIESQILKDFK